MQFALVLPVFYTLFLLRAASVKSGASEVDTSTDDRKLRLERVALHSWHLHFARVITHSRTELRRLGQRTRGHRIASLESALTTDSRELEQYITSEEVSLSRSCHWLKVD